MSYIRASAFLPGQSSIQVFGFCGFPGQLVAAICQQKISPAMSGSFKGPKKFRNESVKLDKISFEEGVSGWRKLSGARLAEIEADLRAGCYKQTITKDPSLLVKADASGRQLVHDGLHLLSVWPDLGLLFAIGSARGFPPRPEPRSRFVGRSGA